VLDCVELWEESDDFGVEGVVCSVLGMVSIGSI